MRKPDVFIKGHQSANTKSCCQLKKLNGGRDGSVIDNAQELERKKNDFNARYEFYRATNKTFPELAATLMGLRHWNSTMFKEKTLLGDAEYSKLINKNGTYDNKPWTLRTIMAICVGLGVDQLTGERMLSAAGLTFGASHEQQTYAYVLSSFHGASIDEVNTFLESVNVKPLGNLARKAS
jgi:hypothetical protein